MQEQVAALYVDSRRGPYAAIPGVELWDAKRDARGYAGPWPVIAHPPCAPWGRYYRWSKGGDGEKELAPIAVGQVRAWGGVLEHPAHSRLWKEPLGLPLPGELPDRWGGITVEVEQGGWGHPAPKKTWIYAVGVELMLLARPSPGFIPRTTVEQMSSTARRITPALFAGWLVELARSSVKTTSF